MRPPHHLECRALAKRFGVVEAVTDVTFDDAT